jgi:hypothetical protein
VLSQRGGFGRRVPFGAHILAESSTTFVVLWELVELGTVSHPGNGVVGLTDMRGDERIQDGMFSYVSLEQRVPQDHPLRAARKLPTWCCGV